VALIVGDFGEKSGDGFAAVGHQAGQSVFGAVDGNGNEDLFRVRDSSRGGQAPGVQNPGLEEGPRSPRCVECPYYRFYTGTGMVVGVGGQEQPDLGIFVDFGCSCADRGSLVF
jgi:hypothetical protein